MKALACAVAVLLVACATGDKKVDVGPDPAGGSESSAANGVGGSSSAGVGGSSSAGVGGSSTGPGSGGGESSIASYISGSRLRARYYDGDDGSRQYVGWYDSDLDANCVFNFGSDAVRRCLPSPFSISVVYSDSGCTQPIYGHSKLCSTPPPKYAHIPPGQCQLGWAVHELGAQATLTTLYYKSGSNCFEGAVSQDTDYYSLEPELAPTTFVEAEEKVE